ncbi:putative HTH-type transcriptional regulator Rv1985c [Arthrobacter sp. Bi26]|uniref:ArgP/LysG family DNA-binding transcriptional regulator n=1 Tax=Arthrobacter sp. Bi26 TaxID=2822350 RepID=UPI001D8D35AA|nr:ArgP/LysG family DNA-binding transcriptional regulator [Arthrobacter sp. Bi26]CAH0192271.1 putative HTH-type transcriptional regulator Rv1985c [Arthrobacter sp. Bi26]
MMEISPEQARTLAAILTYGSFDAAAAHLSVTPSAVSQRVRALEAAVGRPVLTRARPPGLTESGEAVVRFARQLELLSADLAEELQPEQPRAGTRLTLVINSDSLHTWALAGLAAASENVQLEILREDQEHSLDLLRAGAAAAAITETAKPVPGCSSSKLGIMRYFPVCAPDFTRRWFGAGVSAATVAAAPVVVFDRRDDLQDRWLRRLSHAPLQPPRHYVPAAQEFGDAIRWGMGWGMMPEIEIGEDLETGRLETLSPRAHVDVALYWQQWRRGSAALTDVADAVRAAARVLR